MQAHPVGVTRVDVQKQRRLALGDRLHSGLGQVRRKRRQLVGEFQQQPQLVLTLDFGEVGYHLC
ncbi:hypothetical protein CAB90_03692 [Mycobacterium tuberculosis]|uniref:Uncharacterized protein n=1 Tax=Mycobacterium tuberculosis TaxID=1773 RepID=A0A2I7WC95_MYCTX|nr:hypothetical protein CAB90_03692 [Mycobacterium tuberculosis]